jgi:ATP-binding cassette, subfamily B, bacterial PglK
VKHLIDITAWRKAWELLDRRERVQAFGVLLVAIVGGFASAGMVGSVMPFLSVLADPSRIETVPQLARAYGRFGFTSAYGFLIALGIASLLVILVAVGVQILKTYVIARFTTMRVYSISSRLMGRYLSQPYEYFLDHHSGDMGTRVLAEANEVVGKFLKPTADFVVALLSVVAIVGFLLWVEPLVTLVAFAVLGGAYGMVYALVRTRLRQLGKARAVANSERYRIATEALGGVKDIKLLGRERSYVDRFRVPAQRMARVQLRTALMQTIPTQAMQALIFGGVIVLCIVLLDPVGFADGTALGVILPLLGVFALAGQRLMPELNKLYSAAATIQTGRAALDMVHDDLFGGDAQRKLPRQSPAPLGLRQMLEFRDVSYRYPQAELAGVTDVSFTIRSGERIGIVGGTGAGKTTLADLVLGLLAPGSGEIVADGTVLEDANIRAWQRSVGYVPQEIFLTDSNVAENIALGVPPSEIDMDRISRAARIAQIDQFIREELPQGYDTTVGERGVRLSGGQRQRIGIARALYHDADLIVFDEATSALDNLTEREVMSAIDALSGDKTVLMIAHRLSTVEHCDRILVLEQGRLVGCDTWDNLMAENAAFRKIASIRDAA